MPKHVHALERPSKDAICALEPFPGLPLSRIHQPRSREYLHFAHRELVNARVVGFDTETKQEFAKGAVNDGPHVVQLATLHYAFVFSMDHQGSRELVREILEAEHITKVGFGLAGDCAAIQRKLGLSTRPTVELTEVVRALGYNSPVGAQRATAIVLGYYLEKPLNMIRSNWARTWLTKKQLRYAANDAYAALLVFHAMGLASESSPNAGHRLPDRRTASRRRRRSSPPEARKPKPAVVEQQQTPRSKRRVAQPSRRTPRSSERST
jgi:hypothetical protein